MVALLRVAYGLQAAGASADRVERLEYEQTHFTRHVLQAHCTKAYVANGVDSLTVALCRMKFAGETCDAVVSPYATTEGAVITNAPPLRSVELIPRQK